MLSERTHPSGLRLRPRRESGMVLIVALVVLVAMTLVAISLVRSSDTSNLIAGNLAFQRAATHAGDTGVEAAIHVIQDKALSSTLDSNDTTNGYFATLRPADSPQGAQTWDAFWSAQLRANAVNVAADQFGNSVSYVIHRHCANALPPAGGGQCVASPVISQSTGNAEEAGSIQLTASSKIYYRITVRVTGPRRTVSYVQSHVAM